MHRLDLAHVVPALGRQVDEEAGVGRLGPLGVVLGAGDQDREARSTSARDEPLVPVDHPLVAVLIGAGLDERRVRTGDLGLGHGEAAHHPPLAERPEVLLLLLVGRPVQECVHVALVGRLAVHHPRPEVGLRRLGLDHRHLGVAEAHATPLLGHVGQPQTGLLRLVAHREQNLQVLPAVYVFAVAYPGLTQLHGLLDELANAQPEVFELGREGEVDRHGSASGDRTGAGEEPERDGVEQVTYFSGSLAGTMRAHSCPRALCRT